MKIIKGVLNQSEIFVLSPKMTNNTASPPRVKRVKRVKRAQPYVAISEYSNAESVEQAARLLLTFSER